ncbi:MAG TPA: peptidoglycan endopeptidase [Ignavibacteria bacterium]|nr:peptidoglycan endopeptidase [Ignavibacteria bacterium]
MKRTSNIFLSLFLLLLFFQDASAQQYAVAKIFTPVLNTPDFESVFGGNKGNRVKLDNKGLIREMEFIAFPNTVFNILEVIPKNGYDMYRVTTDDYQYKGDFYIDSRFVTLIDTKIQDREQLRPKNEIILENLKTMDGYPYMWGGNVADGISEMLEYYQPKTNLSENTESLWKLRGVDCSGLIYQATGGTTPRNTSSLITYGSPVEIQGLSASEIKSKLRPLDLIVWNGHVIIVLDENTVIESTPDPGVHKSDLLSRLQSVMSERTAVNDWETTSGKRFVIRRWAE